MAASHFTLGGYAKAEWPTYRGEEHLRWPSVGRGSSGRGVAYDVNNGSVLWHCGLHAPVSNTPIAYLVDGNRYDLVGAEDSLYAFSIQAAKGAAC